MSDDAHSSPQLTQSHFVTTRTTSTLPSLTIGQKPAAVSDKQSSTIRTCTLRMRKDALGFVLLTLLLVNTMVLLFMGSFIMTYIDQNNNKNNISNNISNNNKLPAPRPHTPRGCRLPQRAPRAIEKRSDLGSILEEMNFTHGVEVGVQSGRFAANTLSLWKSCQSYSLVDIWAMQDNYKDVANVDNQKQEEYYQDTVKILKPWSGITHFFRMRSTEAARQMSPSSLDFAYIDARHDYCGCLEDIEAYWPLLKPGGIMAGHDFLYASEVKHQDWSICSDGTINKGAVRGAVDEFFSQRGITVSVVYRDGAWPTWIAVKPHC